MNDDDLELDLNTVGIDLSGYDTGTNYIFGGASVDTITLDPTSTITSNVTFPSMSATTSYITGGGYTVNNTNSVYYTGQAAANDAGVQIDVGGIKIPDEADIQIGNRSLKDFMSKMEERFSILVPDPKKLEQFEALRKAYENYKLMEKLCQQDEGEIS